MPELSRFFGIVISMYYQDHTFPHFHAEYGEFRMSMNALTGELLAGKLPPRARRLVSEWYELHRNELLANWELSRNKLPLNKIAPLE